MRSLEPEPQFTVTRLSTAPAVESRAASSSFPKIPGYRLTEIIGEGGASTVYLAEDARTEDPRAVKIYYDDASASFADLEREALRGVDHPHIVRLWGSARAQSEDGQTFPANILEYLPGGSVLSVVRSGGPQSIGQTCAIVVPIAAAVAYLHGSGVIHGDITPDNVLFAADGTPKLIDGSASQRVGQRLFESGTAGFHAPEAVDPARLQPERDVYSLGALTWFLLTGRIPSLTSHRPALSVFIRGVSADLVNLVEACLDEDPAVRPSAADVSRRLRKIAEPEPIDITVTAADHAIPFLRTSHHFDREAALKRARRRTQKMWASVTIGALLAVAGIFMILPPGGESTTAHAEPPTQPAPAPPLVPAEDGIVAQLSALTAARDQALMDQDEAALLAVHADNSRSLRQDQQTIAALAKDKLRYEQLATTLTNVRVTQIAPAGKATVRADSATSPFVIARAGSTSAQPVAAVPVQQLEFSLVKEGERWQISDVALLGETRAQLGSSHGEQNRSQQ